MKILLFGKNGQVGWELNRSLQPLGDVISLGRRDVDFSNPQSLRAIVREVAPDVIINAVAYTAVDKAEEEEQLAEKINAVSPGILAEESLKLCALLIHYSTDYVFDGAKTEPYVETDKTNPINAYGRTKLAGEQVVQQSGCDYLILRTSWVYSSRGHNFLLTILKLAKERETLNIVSCQHGAPTSARLIADTTTLCVQQAIKERVLGVFSSDLYHLTASGVTSWYGFAESAIDLASDMNLTIKRIKPISTAQYPTPAKRPMNSQLQLTKLESIFGVTMPDWKILAGLCIEEIMNKAP